MDSRCVWIGEGGDAAIQVVWDTFSRRRVEVAGEVCFASSVDKRNDEYKEMLASVKHIQLELLFGLGTI